VHPQLRVCNSLQQIRRQSMDPTNSVVTGVALSAILAQKITMCIFCPSLLAPSIAATTALLLSGYWYLLEIILVLTINP